VTRMPDYICVGEMEMYITTPATLESFPAPAVPIYSASAAVPHRTE
jgi:hypothetical protein